MNTASRFKRPGVVALALVALAALAGCASQHIVSTAPDEGLLGKSRGYPIGTRATWFTDETVRVGSFSNLDRILPYRVLYKSDAPLPLAKAAHEPALRYTDRKSTRLNSSHSEISRMPSSA